jgi:hypothetical protein
MLTNPAVLVNACCIETTARFSAAKKMRHEIFNHGLVHRNFSEGGLTRDLHGFYCDHYILFNLLTRLHIGF